MPGLREPSREQERVWWQGGEPLVGELSSKPGKLSGLLPGELAGKLVWEGAERGLREKERESVGEREIAGGCCESQDILREEKVGKGIWVKGQEWNLSGQQDQGKTGSTGFFRLSKRKCLGLLFFGEGGEGVRFTLTISLPFRDDA